MCVCLLRTTKYPLLDPFLYLSVCPPSLPVGSGDMLTATGHTSPSVPVCALHMPLAPCKCYRQCSSGLSSLIPLLKVLFVFRCPAFYNKSKTRFTLFCGFR